MAEKAFEIMKSQLELRWSLKPYISGLMEETTRNGAPLLRTMFYEFPEDEKCWELDDQYMFGDKYLVAPVLKAGMKERKVYLPEGVWKDIADGKEYTGGQTLTCETPIERIPVFERM